MSCGVVYQRLRSAMSASFSRCKVKEKRKMTNIVNIVTVGVVLVCPISDAGCSSRHTEFSQRTNVTFRSRTHPPRLGEISPEPSLLCVARRNWYVKCLYVCLPRRRGWMHHARLGRLRFPLVLSSQPSDGRRGLRTASPISVEKDIPRSPGDTERYRAIQRFHRRLVEYTSLHPGFTWPCRQRPALGMSFSVSAVVSTLGLNM